MLTSFSLMLVLAPIRRIWRHCSSVQCSLTWEVNFWYWRSCTRSLKLWVCQFINGPTRTEKSNSSISKTALAKALRRIPFVLSALYLVASGVIASWMFAEGLLFEITDPKYIVLTSAELALVILDIYGMAILLTLLVVLQLYVLKRGNPDSQVILFRIAFVIGISALMKAATVVLFWLDLDPFWR